MALSLEDVRKVASLARLSLTAEEEQHFLVQLSAILDAMKQLESVDTTGVEPMTHASMVEGALRPDEVQPSLPSRGPFRVPKIIE